MAPPALRFRSAYTYLFAIALIAILCTATLFVSDYHVVGAITRHSFGNPFAKSPGPSNSDAARPDFHSHPTIDVNIPSNVKVIAIVFFGRRDLVKILDCYLKRNLKDNGGLLDQVIFAVKTDNKDDLSYLEELITTSPRYSKHASATEESEGWNHMWRSMTDPDAIYFKIDDDVVFIEDTTIPSVVQRLLENPQYFAVSANVVNNPVLSWVHFSMGVVHEPYFPEMTPPEKSPSPSWRASQLPNYTGPENGPKDFNIDGSTPAPFEGHRWLPVRVPAGAEKYDIMQTPVSTLSYEAWGPSLTNWAAGAQLHYSWLQHLELGDTWRYKFNIWDFAYQRLSINFIAFRGKDIINALPFPGGDDEQYLTVGRPRELRRHVVADGRGMVVHLAFGPQYRAHEFRGLRWTDLLGRYQMYADEMICSQPRKAQTITRGLIGGR